MKQIIRVLDELKKQSGTTHDISARTGICLPSVATCLFHLRKDGFCIITGRVLGKGRPRNILEAL